MDDERRILAGDDGSPVLSYVKGSRDGEPWAGFLEVLGPGAADLIMARWPGWFVSVPEDFSGELIGRGARLVRHVHAMSCDLRGRPPSKVRPPGGFRFVPCDRPPEDLLTTWTAAYPPDHPDHEPRDEAHTLSEHLVPLLRGEVVGDLLPCSRLAVDADDTVVGGVLVNDWRGTPLVSDIARHPAGSPAGLGSALLATVMDAAAADGHSAMDLAVTHANPARRVYERLGFTVVRTTVTVRI
ncbi:GNAT family N-acetyltransferase [Planotetraspora kaengkrachanensis]|nr:GNAT family N-acetyltransferase [Planotetraspora kaengkrachanensis]